jgi:hypothetical protein
MILAEGKYTIETFAKKQDLSRQSALNLLSKLKKQGFVKTSGGGNQKRIYTLSKTPRKEPNGFFSLLNKYSPEKISPSFEHHIYGKYSAERAIIDGILFQSTKKDIRIRNAMFYLFWHIKNWKLLFDLAKKEGVVNEVHKLYNDARQRTRCKTMPKRYAL